VLKPNYHMIVKVLRAYSARGVITDAFNLQQLSFSRFVHDCGLAGPELSIREIDTIFIAVNYGGKHSKLNPRLSVVRARSASLCCAGLSLTPSPRHPLTPLLSRALTPPLHRPSLPHSLAASLVARSSRARVPLVCVSVSRRVSMWCRRVAVSLRVPGGRDSTRILALLQM
jgi:hypothetical protein